MVFRKNVRTEVSPGDSAISGKLNCGPVLGVQKHSFTNPKGNGLLADLAETRQLVGGAKLSNPGSEKMLAANNLDSSNQRCDVHGNVVLLHDRRRTYTRNLVIVNKNSSFTGNKEACTVLSMSTTLKKKPAAPPKGKAVRKRASEPEVGPDGRTLGQRVVLLMQERGIGQAELARMCSQYYATFVPLADDKVKQQHIFNIIQGQSSAWAVPLIAAIFDVSDMWLQYGIGKRERAVPVH